MCSTVAQLRPAPTCLTTSALLRAMAASSSAFVARACAAASSVRREPEAVVAATGVAVLVAAGVPCTPGCKCSSAR